ncbi:hypothetical protein PgNI_10633 [Pyricularia grisea]|uniref:Uncharacterized protein n=1 Tax=Pyricularia grisea TaxID=148305 RepID=A0A6P8AXT7_PYRGI|nr:hypothetical protein PgNI_10633 [Pyricularia grisea]TLD07160.1 hypothetical protein PgNI_10633 [Pyricularia grisea]
MFTLISVCLHKAIENASAGLNGPAGYEPSCCGVASMTSTCRNEEWGLTVGRLTVSRIIECVGLEKKKKKKKKNNNGSAKLCREKVQQLPKRGLKFNFQAHISHFASCYTQTLCDLKPDMSPFGRPQSA